MTTEELESEHHVCIDFKLSRENFDMVCNSLKKNKQMRILRIDKHSINSRLGVFLLEVLRGHKSIEDIAVHGNGIEYKDMKNMENGALVDEDKAIGKLLEYNQTLKRIDLSYNGFDPETTKWICKGLMLNYCLKFLDLDNNYIGPEGAVYVGEMLATNKTLEGIRLAYNDIGDEGSRMICHAMVHNTTLKFISLTKNQITDARPFMEMIELNRTLSELYIDHNHIGDDGVVGICKVLSGNNTISDLALRNNDISAIGAKAVGGMLSTNKTLISIDVSYNDIDTDGIGHIVEGISKNHTLKSIYMHENPGICLIHPHVSLGITSNYSIEKWTIDNSVVQRIVKRNRTFMKFTANRTENTYVLDNVACIELDKTALLSALKEMNCKNPRAKTLVISFCDTAELE